MSNIHWNNVIFFSKNEGMMQQCQSILGGMTAAQSARQRHSKNLEGDAPSAPTFAAACQDGDAQRIGWSRLCIQQRRRCAAEAWDDTTEAPGGAEEAHRRWPEGRSEQGASKAKVIPPFGTKGGAERAIGAAAPYPTLGYKPSSGSSASCHSTGAGCS